MGPFWARCTQFKVLVRPLLQLAQTQMRLSTMVPQTQKFKSQDQLLLSLYHDTRRIYSPGARQQ
jgi:hypothetical protein